MEITLEKIRNIADKTGFNIEMIEKDYLLTKLLFLIKDIDGMYFKGGTALNKIFLNHERLSEDLDFTLTKPIKEIEKEILGKLKGSIFNEITYDKKVDRFTRMVVHYKLFHEKGTIFLDLNERGKLVLKPEKHKVIHFYGEYIPEFYVSTVAKSEMVAEKMADAIGRNRPRDHFDLYNIISHNVSIDIELVKKKCKESGDEFNIVKIFNKSNRLKNQWDQDVNHQLSDTVSFATVMQTIAKYFKLKEEKDKLKDKKKVSSHTFIN